MIERLSRKAFDLIVRYETGGKSYYEKFLKRPTWPGGASGVTIGFGYDLGYEQNLDRDWGPFLAEDELERLNHCLGKVRGAARQALSGVRDIVIRWDWAEDVFNDNTLPQEIRKTLKVYPGSADILSADAFGALVSLIFNRGTDLTGERRIEMRAIYQILKDPKYQPFPVQHREEIQDRIASAIRGMKRLWKDTPSDQDLVDRREDEARLVEGV